MPINHWLSPYMMEPSSKTPSLPATTAAAAAAVFRSHAAAFRLNLNTEDDGEDSPPPPPPPEYGAAAAREPLFEKPLTPSDVGKLNRLVIPKQHAEKYFPLNGGGAAGGGEKGLLLGFEDEIGKSWRFRYSYWNSSQSYVLTKGWSRFVKEKRLDAGDVVLFARHAGDLGRLFIGWRRRNAGKEAAVPPLPPCGLLYSGHPYPNHFSNNSSVLYQTDCPHPHAENHVKGRNGNSKRLRLFGVNLEWDDVEEPEHEPSTSGSGKGQGHEEPYHEYYSSHGGDGRTVSYVCDSTNI